MSCQVIDEMLWHLKAALAARDGALVSSDAQVTLYMLTQLGDAREVFLAVCEGAALD